MKFRMKDGSVVEASKDCECCTHEGPHWLHMDQFAKEENQKLLKTNTLLGQMGFVKNEQTRLTNKLNEMETRGIIEIIRKP